MILKRGPLSCYSLWAFCIAILIFHQSVHASKTCYTPNGDDRNGAYSTPQNSTYQPCDPTEGTVSMCCASWDTCMPNGLCWNDAYKIWWRESCTDPDFTDPNCVKLFLNITDDVNVSNCTDGSWCIGNNNTACCAEHTGVFLLANNSTIPVLSNSTSSGTSTSTSTQSQTPPPSSSKSASSVHSSTLSTGAKAALGTAVPVAMLLGLGLIYYISIQRRRSKQALQHNLLADVDSPTHIHEALSLPIYEKDSSRTTTHTLVELDGDQRRG